MRSIDLLVFLSDELGLLLRMIENGFTKPNLRSLIPDSFFLAVDVLATQHLFVAEDFLTLPTPTKMCRHLCSQVSCCFLTLFAAESLSVDLWMYYLIPKTLSHCWGVSSQSWDSQPNREGNTTYQKPRALPLWKISDFVKGSETHSSLSSAPNRHSILLAPCIRRWIAIRWYGSQTWHQNSLLLHG